MDKETFVYFGWGKKNIYINRNIEIYVIHQQFSLATVNKIEQATPVKTRVAVEF